MVKILSPSRDFSAHEQKASLCRSLTSSLLPERKKESLWTVLLCVLQVVTEGRLILEFTFDDIMRIRSWHFATRQHRELIPRSVIAMQQDPAMVEQLSKNITRQGLTNSTLNFLRVSTWCNLVSLWCTRCILTCEMFFCRGEKQKQTNKLQ